MIMVSPLAGRRAAPTLPAMGAPSPLQSFADAHNALAMALHYLHQPRANVPGAARKTVQALAALRELFLLDAPATTAAQAQQVVRGAGHV